MKNSPQNKAVKSYRKSGGNFRTGIRIPLKKESDLSSYYYPGIVGVLKKIEEKPEQQLKLCSLNKTVGVISTKPEHYYPLTSAKAALISEVTDLNAIPLMLKYDKVKYLGMVIENISRNFQVVLCTDFSPLERAVTKKMYKGNIPLLFHEEMEAAAVVASILSSCKALKMTPKKARVTIEGTGQMVKDIIGFLKEENFLNITFLDERGPIYNRRPNINREKKELLALVKTSKDNRTRNEVLNESDIYINAKDEEVTQLISGHLPEKAALIALEATTVEPSKKQMVISTLPTLSNHITDLHITAAIMTALCEGKKMSDKTISQSIYGLSKVYKTPQPKRLIPGLLEKNMANKVAKEIK